MNIKYLKKKVFLESKDKCYLINCMEHTPMPCGNANSEHSNQNKSKIEDM